MAEDLRGRVVLLEHAADVEDRDAVTHLHRFFDVVGHEHDRLLHLVLHAQELVLQPGARDRVDRAERLVHQQHRWIGGERPRHADALALPTRELVRIAVAVLLGIEADELRGARRRAARCRFLSQPSSRRHGRDVVFDRLVREQPDLLDDVADAPAQLHGIDVGDVFLFEVDATAGRLDQAVDHAQQRRLAAA